MPPGKLQVIQTLIETGVVAVVSIDDPTDLLEAARALNAGGIRMVEITMAVPRALDVIASVSRQLGDQVHIGAGTVLDAVTARMAILAGASFVVGPRLDMEIVRQCKLYDVAVMLGAMTPYEIVMAWKAGADVVEVFPGRVGTPGFFQDLQGPLPQIRMMPGGSVDLKNAPEYIKAGAVAVRVGRTLVDVKAVKAKQFGTITENARTFRRIVAEARGTNP
jgi:2-dehydro-3-deoxyphosphogluconate aldolase / (4S)-4-hydroxy-2-oxoglutarate aldolase